VIRRVRPWLYMALARRRLYPLFDLLGRVADVGTNRGNVDAPATSGERHVLELLADPELVVDVGANRGEYVQLVRTRWPRARVLAVEPSAEARAAIPGDPQVEVSTVALGAQPADGVLVGPGPGSKLGRVVPGPGEGTPVTITTLDELCATTGIDRIDLLKVDVEGGELDVLRGAVGLLDGHRIGVVQFEFGFANLDRGDTLAAFVDLLRPAELHVVLVDGVRRVDYHPRLEQPLTRNFVAVLPP
jgi:FkbM family methyltransferase